MELRLTDSAKEDIRFFVRSGQKSVLKKIEILLTEIKSDPFTGTGKPELLKHNLSGQWSRRITREHRLIYEMKEDHILVHSARGHYDY
jgi:toxin YoeB